MWKEALRETVSNTEGLKRLRLWCTHQANPKTHNQSTPVARLSGFLISGARGPPPTCMRPDPGLRGSTWVRGRAEAPMVPRPLVRLQRRLLRGSVHQDQQSGVLRSRRRGRRKTLEGQKARSAACGTLRANASYGVSERRRKARAWVDTRS